MHAPRCARPIPQRSAFLRSRIGSEVGIPAATAASTSRNSGSMFPAGV